MRTEESAVSGLGDLFFAVIRGLSIIAGGSVVSYWLATRIDVGRVGTGGDLPNYWGYLSAAMNPSTPVTEAMGNTMVLAAAAVLLGVAEGAILGLLLRINRLGTILGYVVVGIMALSIPGLALFPLADLAGREGLAPTEAVYLDESLGDGLRFLLVWGSLAGLSIAPAAAASLAGSTGRLRFGVGQAENLLAARPESDPRWRFGFPTTAFLLALASAELLSGQRGVFPLLFGSLTSGALLAVLTLTFWVVVGGAGLALAIDLVERYRGDGRPGPAPVAVTRSPLALPLMAAVVVIIGVASIGLLLDDPYAAGVADPMAAPTFAGPWLGSDQLGRSLLATTAAGLGPSIMAGALPGLVAVVLGAGVALIVRGLPGPAGRLTAAAVDGLWWPSPMVLPLVFLAFASPDRPELHPGVILFTGATLVPLAGRLVGRTVLAADDALLIRAVAAWLFCSATAMSIHVLLGFTGFAGPASQSGLGSLMADGFRSYDLGRWPLLVPAGASVLVLGLLYGLAAALTVPARTPALTGVATVRPEPGSDRFDPAGAEPAPGDGDWVVSVPVTADGAPTTQQSGRIIESDAPLGDQPPLDHPAITTAGAVEAPRRSILGSVDERPGQVTDAGETEVDCSEAIPAAAPDTAAPQTAAPDTAAPITAAPDDPADDRSAIELEASRTVELRPSTLRRAGIAARPMPKSPTDLSSGWSKPILASRPGPPTDPPEDQDEPE